MRSVWVVVLALLLCAAGVAAAPPQGFPDGVRPVHTYSIVARDPQTGQLGVAVQSHWFAVGSLVPWAQAGVGAVATQSFVEVRYGSAGLDLMRSGLSAERSLAALLEADAHSAVRQVAMVDAGGVAAAHTGTSCIQYAGHLVGDNFAVQSNLMLKAGVPEAMAAAFSEAQGTLAERMLAALDAAQAQGGDLRGRQSAAILVVSGQASGRPWEDRLVDLHVEDHPEPLQELRRLLTLHTAYEHMNRGDHALERGAVDDALAEYGYAEALQPDNLEMKFWHAVSLVNAGRAEAALPLFAAIFSQDERWRELVPRLAAAGLLATRQAVVERIIQSGTQPGGER